MEDIKVLIFDDRRFNEITELAGSDEKNVFTCLHEDWSYVIIREGFVKEISEDELVVVLAHEFAHLNGIIDEEEADRWALENLSKEHCKEILINMWNERHGHKYTRYTV